MNVYANDKPLAMLHVLAMKLAPCLDGCGLRLLRHPESWPLHPSTAAYMITGRSLRVRGELQRRGEWPGYWGCGYIVFADTPTVGLLIHELAHVLPGTAPLADMEPTAEQAAAQLAASTKWETRDRAIDLWQGHEAPFIRRCLHLHHRAWELGVETPLPEVSFAGRQYALSPSWCYKSALGDEPQRFRQLSFTTIDSVPPPPEFAELFDDDVRRYHENKVAEDK